MAEEFRSKYEGFLTGCDALEEMEQWDLEEYGDMDVYYQTDMVSIVLRLTAADGEISEKEIRYLDDYFGFGYTAEELGAVYENCREEISGSFAEQFRKGFSLLNGVSARLADRYRELISLICDIIVESDGVIAAAEIKEAAALKKLVEN